MDRVLLFLTFLMLTQYKKKIFFGNLEEAQKCVKRPSSFWIPSRKKDIRLETIKLSIHFCISILKMF